MIRPPLKIRRVTHFRIVWRGITIKLKYHFQYTKAFRYQDSCDAITVYVIGPNADLCPLTSTGFLAMHIPTKTLRLSGGPVAHVTRLLTAAAAADPKWIKTECRRRQFDLFRPTVDR